MVKIQLIAFYTLVRRELLRMLRIASQVFLPPVILTALYFIIFGTLIGNRIGSFENVSYILFITPGLIMMSVINNAYTNVSSSLFGVRFQKSVEEILVSPMLPSLFLLGYVMGGIIRGVLVALLVYLVSSLFLHIEFHHLFLTIVVVLLVSAMFSLAGFLNGMLARTFDDVVIVPTFILTPLTYLGGVFYPTTLLSPLWSTITHLNPIFYMINALRYAMIGYEEISIFDSLAIIVGLLIILTLISLLLLRRGVGLKD